MIEHNILATGSTGNAVIVGQAWSKGKLLIDVGIAYSRLADYLPTVQAILLTHIHGDHFKKTAVKKIAYEKPSMRWLCGGWMVEKLIECGVKRTQIDVFEVDTIKDYGAFKVQPYQLFHDVPNFGWLITWANKETCFYATDTAKLDHINLPKLDLYLVEANYHEDELEERAVAKIKAGEYSHEKRVRENHISYEKTMEWLAEQVGNNSEYVLLHQHVNEG